MSENRQMLSGPSIAEVEVDGMVIIEFTKLMVEEGGAPPVTIMKLSTWQDSMNSMKGQRNLKFKKGRGSMSKQRYR
jgi:hypothetical protein